MPPTSRFRDFERLDLLKRNKRFRVVDDDDDDYCIIIIIIININYDVDNWSLTVRLDCETCR